MQADRFNEYQSSSNVCENVMIFDQLAKVVEEHVPELIKTVEQSKLFFIDKIPHEFLPKKPETENFFLPFQCVAVEDKASVVVLADTNKKQNGLTGDRIFIEYIPENAPIETFDPNKRGGLNAGSLPIGMLYAGIIGDIEVHPTCFSGSSRLLIMLAIKDKKIIATLKGMPEKLKTWTTEQASQNALIAMQEIMMLNNLENRFILEEKPINPKIKKGMIARSHQRSKYTILEPKIIRKRMGLQPTGKAIEEGYERRRHYRTYRNDRYVNVQGKTVVIEATWVGPSEKQVGKKYYKVRLDL